MTVSFMLDVTWEKGRKWYNNIEIVLKQLGREDA